MAHSVTVPKLPFSVLELTKKINADLFLVIPLAVRTSHWICIQLSTCVVGQVLFIMHGRNWDIIHSLALGT